MKLVAL